MSKLWENKQLMHIVSEVVIILGMFLYFSSQVKTLRALIDDLTDRLETQETELQKHTQQIKNLSECVGHLMNVRGQSSKPSKKNQEPEKKVSFNLPKKEVPVVDSDLDDSGSDVSDDDLDKDLSSELSELAEKNENSEKDSK